MMTKKDETIKCLSGLFFALTAVAEIVFYIQLGKLLGRFSISADMWIDMAGKFMVGAAIFAEVPALVLAGSVVSLLSIAMRMISGGVWGYGVFWAFFWSILAISMLISFVNKKYARLICFGAGGVEMVHFAWAVRQMGASVIELNFRSFFIPLSILLLAVGAILLGIALPEMLEKPKKRKNAVKQPQYGTESKIEQLEKLNALLEKGYITKEEFDAKKDQIMNPKV